MTEVSTKEMTETEALFHSLDKPSLHALSYALRHPDTWPEGFVWDYKQCEQCAIGLAHRLWNSAGVPAGSNVANVGASQMAKAFAIPFSAATSIFFGKGNWTPTRRERRLRDFWRARTYNDLSQVTPEMVATQIDNYLARAE